MNAMLIPLIRYQNWADAQFCAALARPGLERDDAVYQRALRLLDHIHVVARIFAAHLVGEPHGLTSDTSDPTPEIQPLSRAMAETNGWYLDYVGTLRPEALGERIAFTFTDGDRASMTRAEMLMHVVLHGTVHRGELGALLGQIGAPIPWDTLAVFLHQSEPSRREAGFLQPLSA